MMNPGTALGIAATQLAQQGQYKPFTSDGKPTVVAKNLADISQREAAKQAGVAQQIEAMKMAQMQQAIKEMAAKRGSSPMASGLGSLPGDVAPQGMAEGGVVGYSGLDGSDVEVDETKLPVGERIKRGLRRLYEDTGLAEKRASYLQRTGATPEMAAKTMAKEMAEPTATPPAVATDTGAEYEKLFSRYKRPTTPREIEAQVKEQPGTSYQPDARLFSSAAKKTPPAAANTKPADTGLPALMGPAVPSGSERQFAGALAAQGRMEIPAERTPQQFRKQTEDYYRSLGIDPDFAKQRMSRIEAQEARDRAEAEERAKLVEGRKMENLISRLARVGGAGSLARGLGQAQLGMEPVIAAQRASDERFNAVMRERQVLADRERTAIEDMQRALADGDISRAEKSRDTALAARNAKNELEAKTRAQYAPQLLQAETAAAQIAASAKEGEANRANQVLVAKLQLSKPSDLQERIALLAKNPEQFKRIYGDKMAVDLAELRAKLLSDYSKNAMTLTTQGIKSFDDYLALYGQNAMIPGGTSTPPPGAVREKGKQ
jgi:hypothetical protein